MKSEKSNSNNKAAAAPQQQQEEQKILAVENEPKEINFEYNQRTKESYERRGLKVP